MKILRALSVTLGLALAVVLSVTYLLLPKLRPIFSSSFETKLENLEQQIAGLRSDLTGAVPGTGTADSDGRKGGKYPVPGTGKKNFKPGAILDVWLADGKAFDVPATPSFYTIIDRTAPFQFNRILEEPDMMSYKGKALGLAWSGYIDIVKTGEHLFVLDFIVGSIDAVGNSALQSPPWHTFFTLKNEQVFVNDVPLADGKQNSSQPFTFVRTMEPGKYEFRFWIVPTALLPGNFKYDYSRLAMTLKIKEPGDTTPMVIGPDRVFHLE